MGNTNFVDMLQGDFSFINKLYDSIRIVNPKVKHVMSFEDGKIETAQHMCYHYWSHDKMCDNCISMRAFNENDVCMKMERKGDRLIMIIAVPMNLDGRKVVVELLKDVTNNMVYGDNEKESIAHIDGLVRHFNQVVVNDSLTNIFNRRYIDERLPVDIAMSYMKKKPLSLIMADIDHFKYVNDTYGHVAGDYVLKEVAKTLKDSIRLDVDWVARYGGEEFLICLKNTGLFEAQEVAERMRLKISEGIYEYNCNKIKITTSFGVCSILNEIVKAERLIDCADKKLYEAKRTGRNKVV